MKTKDTIRKILLEKPHLRDNDNKLIASFWYRELNNKNIDAEEITALNFLHKYAYNEHSPKKYFLNLGLDNVKWYNKLWSWVISKLKQ